MIEVVIKEIQNEQIYVLNLFKHKKYTKEEADAALKSLMFLKDKIESYERSGNLSAVDSQEK